jgi:hypothetical protein
MARLFYLGVPSMFGSLRVKVPSQPGLGVDRPQITPAFDVYMLGKVLWCMLSGRQKLYRENFTERHLDLTKMFPKDPDKHVINQILRKCVVRYEEDCLPHAGELLLWVQRTAEKLQAGGHIIREGVPRRCRVCGEGEYLPEFREKGKDDPSTSLTVSRVFNGLAEGAGKITLQAYACDKCGHVQFFKPPPRRLQFVDLPRYFIWNRRQSMC